MKNWTNRDLDLIARKRRITWRWINPFAPGSFHNDVTPKRTRPKDPDLLSKLLNYQSLGEEIPDLTSQIKQCCDELVTKKTKI